MRSEKEKMLAGELYDPLDQRLAEERRRARLLVRSLNDTRDDQTEERRRLVAELIPRSEPDVWIEPPFYCDYGSNIVLGTKVFFNFNCVVLDVDRRSAGGAAPDFQFQVGHGLGTGWARCGHRAHPGRESKKANHLQVIGF